MRKNVNIHAREGEVYTHSKQLESSGGCLAIMNLELSNEQLNCRAVEMVWDPLQTQPGARISAKACQTDETEHTIISK